MQKYLRRLKIYHIPLLVCLIFALIQLTLSSSFTLTRWEGGGFGMYSEPSPVYSRIIWLTIKNSNSEFRVRLHPLDKDLSQHIKNLEDKKIKNNWNKLIKESERIRNFPKLRTSNRFLGDIATSLLDLNENINNRMRINSSKIEVSLDVFQLNLDIESKVLKSEKLFSQKIEI